MRTPDKPLPGDVVIKCREDHFNSRVVNLWEITHWPDGEQVIAGPYQSYNYALQQAHRFLRDPSEFIWRDHARLGESEHLELVGTGAGSAATSLTEVEPPSAKGTPTPSRRSSR